jgi:hypothetical protein
LLPNYENINNCACYYLDCFLADKIGLWLERKGWLYYRHEKPRGGAFGNALQELNAQLSPSTRYVVEIKQNETKFKKNEADTPSEPIVHSKINLL